MSGPILLLLRLILGASAENSLHELGKKAAMALILCLFERWEM